MADNTCSLRDDGPGGQSDIESLIASAAVVPKLRPSLRRRVLTNACTVHHRHWRDHGVQVAVASVLFALFGLLVGGYYLSLHQQSLPPRVFPADTEYWPGTGASMSGADGAASAQTNEWQLIDSMDQQKTRRAGVLGGELWK